MTSDEIIAYALAHAVATLDMPEGKDEADLSDLLHEYGGRLGIPVPAGDEYQRAVLHRFDPERVYDFPLPDPDERPNLAACIDRARELDCTWINFDQDADTEPGLPTFEW